MIDKKKIDSLLNLREIQGSDRNWNYDPYMQGLYNGIELSLSVIEDREPIFKNAPKSWIYKKPFVDTKKIYKTFLRWIEILFRRGV